MNPGGLLPSVGTLRDIEKRHSSFTRQRGTVFVFVSQVHPTYLGLKMEYTVPRFSYILKGSPWDWEDRGNIAMKDIKNNQAETQRDGGGMDLYGNFLEWHVDRIRQAPFPGNPFDYMEFPIAWDRSRPLIEHLHYIYKAYCKELKDFGIIDEGVQEECKTICESILSAMAELMHYKKGNPIDKLNIIHKKLDFKKYLRILRRNNRPFFRMRAERNRTSEKDFYHVPFDQLYYSKSYRFSVMGHPCLYLGYSKEVCFAEMESTEGSIAEFKIRGINTEFKIMDLTLVNIKNSNDMFRIWPVLAACYVAPPRSEKEVFKEEYIFPQLLTEYIMTKLKVEGLMYYSCRNKELNPLEETYVNLVLFSKMQASGYEDLCCLNNIPMLKPKYDETLMGKLKIERIYNT